MLNTGADYSQLSQYRNRFNAGEVEHCISIAEVTGSNPIGANLNFSGVNKRQLLQFVQISARITSLYRKLLCWKAFPEADETSVTALADLSRNPQQRPLPKLRNHSTCWTRRRHLFPSLKTNAILHLIKEQCSTNRCQCRQAGLKCTDLCNFDDAEDDGSCDKDPDDDDHESSDVDNVDDDHDDDDDEEEEEDEGD